MTMYNTASQQNVINYPYKPNTILKVVAGPGSGKTQTLLMKIKKMIQNDELLPHQILILSLTNKAIDNIVSNLSKLNNDNNSIDNRLISLINIHTVHSLANKIVEYNEGAIDIIEDNGWRGLLKLIPSKATGDGVFINNNNNTKMNPRILERLIQNFKNGKCINHNKKMGEILKELTEILNTSKVYTNDDLIVKASKYLQKNQYPPIHNDIKLVLIDEYQDLYPLLTPFIKSLMMNQDNTPNDKQLIIFGDINQSIYEFLGNNKQVIDELVNMPGYTTDIIHLEDNFRSSKEIVEYSRLCKPFKNATLDKKTHNYHNKPESGVSPQVMNFYYNKPMDIFYEPLDFILNEICKLICSTHVKLSDIAILARSNAELSILKSYFNNFGIPLEKLTPQPSWTLDSNIVFLIDLMRLANIVSTVDEGKKLDFRRGDFETMLSLSAQRMIGPKTIQLLYHNSQLSGVSMWDFILAKKYPVGVNKPALLSYLNNMKDEIPNWHKITEADELFMRVCVLGYKFGISNGVTTAIDSIEEFEKNITQFYKTLKLCELNKPPEESLLSWFLEKYLEESCIYAKHLKDESMKDIGHLQISTVHASKGLEFPIVFVLDKWRLATNGGYSNDTAPGEYRSGLEPNVKYVAITRARNLLYIINSHDGSIPPPNYNETWNRKSHSNIYNNHSFWEYYCMDLNRPFPGNKAKGSLLEKQSCDTFEELAKKYQFLRRSYHTINCSRVSNRLCRTFLKNIVKR